MAFPRTLTLSLCLLLVSLILPSQASEYRTQQPNNYPQYNDNNNDNNNNNNDNGQNYTPIPTYRPGKPLKRPYNNNNNNPGSSLAYAFLHGQNAARIAVGLPPFVWDDQLAAYAQNWANQRVDDCTLIHSGGPYGENIFWGSDDSYSPESAVDSWVVERRFYDYYSNSCMGGQDCGHYTQIIWRDSTRIGCAKAVCNGGRGVFITCNYDPPGNYLGSRPY